MTKTKVLCLMVITFLMFSCSQENNKKPPLESKFEDEANKALHDLELLENTESEMAETESSEEILLGSEKLDLSPSQIKNKVFDFGEFYHVNQDCILMFECDCCAGIIYFDDNHTFYSGFDCMDDVNMQLGTYKIENKTLYLYFKGYVVREIYSNQNGQDKYEIEKDILQETEVIELNAFECNDKVLIKGKNIDSEFAISPSDMSKKEFDKNYKELIQVLWSMEEGEDRD